MLQRPIRRTVSVIEKELGEPLPTDEGNEIIQSDAKLFPMDILVSGL